MKRILTLALAILIVFGTTACGGKSASSSSGDELGTYTVRVAHGLTLEHPVHQAYEQMKSYVERETDGRVKIEIYPNSQLGGERELVEQVKNGTLEMAYTTVGPLTSFAPEFMVLDIPFLFDSYEEAWMILDSNVGATLSDSLNQYDLELMCWMESGFRHITNNTKPIIAPADLSGMKIRTMEAAMHMANFSALGANPTPVSWTELYLALSQKLVDGQENPVGNIVDIKLYEVQKYLTLDGHLYDAAPMVTNYKWFQSLPAAYQRVLKEGAQMAQNYNRYMNYLCEDQYTQILKDKGMEVIELTSEQKQAFADLGQPAVIAEVKKNIDAAFVDQFLASIEEIKKLETVQVS
ncbi:MAG: DctP family TRAP transporter solute-binding subunit [Anaerotruncus sp.]|nr:DctP family TRAP transporter solute-binding subunit [Anaerotruncus sp.]